MSEFEDYFLCDQCILVSPVHGFKFPVTRILSRYVYCGTVLDGHHFFLSVDYTCQRALFSSEKCEIFSVSSRSFIAVFSSDVLLLNLKPH